MKSQIIYPFDLKFPISEIEKYSAEYVEKYIEKNDPNFVRECRLMELAPVIWNRGFLIKEELKELGLWKSQRSKPKIEANNEDFIKEVTSIAFSTPNERLKIEILTILQGVGWPTASALLHLFHAERYPIIDVRALNSLNCNIENNNYNFDFWEQYTGFAKKIANAANVDMRTLDRALWYYRD